ncbi:MAG TPA: hypothetical protein DDY78_08940 [Planctomycetales bacterium]|jgi:hypothetical protein|nr:hypothetical protein [Planctomycetales bacterium]
MKPAAWRLVITAVLFAGWIGYLGYLVAATRNSIVLSRPQFLVSGLDVIATRKGDDSFLVDEVLYPADKNEEWRGKTIVVRNLKACQIFYSDRSGGVPVPADEDRKYLLPLDIEEGANARVVPTPPSPGYKTGPPRIYPFDTAVLNEYRTVPK